MAYDGLNLAPTTGHFNIFEWKGHIIYTHQVYVYILYTLYIDTLYNVYILYNIHIICIYIYVYRYIISISNSPLKLTSGSSWAMADANDPAIPKKRWPFLVKNLHIRNGSLWKPAYVGIVIYISISLSYLLFLYLYLYLYLICNIHNIWWFLVLWGSRNMLSIYLSVYIIFIYVYVYIYT